MIISASRSTARVSAIVTAIADRYQADGYPRPQMTIDDELIRLGVVRINVFEAQISDVEVRGDPGPHRDAIERMAATLTDAKPLRVDRLQDSLTRMRRLSGLRVSAATSPDAEIPNAYRLELDTDFRGVTGSVRISNRGTDDVGPHMATGQVLVNGLARGRLSAGVSFAGAIDYDEYRGLGVVGSAAVGGQGGALSLTAFRSRATPDEAPGRVVERVVRDILSLRFTRPLLGRTSTSLAVALDATNLSIDGLGFELRDERLRMLKVGVTHNVRGAGVEQLASAELVKGLDAWNSGLEGLGLEDDPRRADFMMLRFNWIRVARISPAWSWRVDALAQQTSYVVPYTERFRVGGVRLGRGFEVASVAGDQGAGTKLEVRRDLLAAPALLGRASLYGFYDIGVVFGNDGTDRASAATAGFGFAVSSEQMLGSIELAKPLTRPDVEGSEDARIFFELLRRL
ncbi:MAG TPA: ShlB/FhaC/HecB family hemolysin secretion/activation protein [Gammaproteobacteria bacterium]